MSLTKEERIAKLEEEMNALKAKNFTTTSTAYGGGGSDLEAFSMKHNHIQKSPDLMPCPRRPPGKK